MRERTTAKNSELYAVIMTFIAAKERIEGADLTNDPDLEFRDDVTRLDRRRILRELVAEVNEAVGIAKEGGSSEAYEAAVEIAIEYAEFFHDGPTKSDRKRQREEPSDPRGLASTIADWR